MIAKIACVLFTASFVAACGVLNLGGTNEDGTPKTDVDARVFVRSLGDAALQTWGTQSLREHAPQVLVAWDANQDSVLTLAEFEAQVNIEDPDAMTSLLILAITLYENRPR